MKVFAACDDFDSKKQPLPVLFPASSAPPASSAVRGFGCGFVAAFQGLGSCSQADQKVWPTLQPKKTSASFATAAFQGFDPGFGCGSVALCFKVLTFPEFTQMFHVEQMAARDSKCSTWNIPIR